MPELPEVETIRRGLNQNLAHKKIKSFWTNWPKKVEPSFRIVKNKIEGKKINQVSRRAKILIFQLDDYNYILIHLKLTGQLILRFKTKNLKLKTIAGGHPQPGGVDNLPNKFTHYVFEFTDGSKLFFNDMRKFGWVKLVSQNQLNEMIGKTGIEPFDKEFTLLNFERVLQKYPNRNVKQTLMDQNLLSGIGNIYADESLFASKIQPTRQIKTLKSEEIKKLHSNIKRILTLAIKHKGTSTDTIYVQHDGQPGGYSKYLKVYGQHRNNCKVCGKPLKKIRLNGRGTHFCPHCQK
ncbi:MAG: DNA-formamidopyrimidine glycosylase [Candidatus Buchananbacteria bacterium]|nr:DNA-formamidopyrimidine glycosylase [Candidatus Buchananbacteria bacterium]